MRWNGLEKVGLGSGDTHIGQNCAPNAMECLPDPKTAQKNSKNVENPENPKNPGFSYFPIGPYRVPIGTLSAVWGHRWSHLDTVC